MSKLIWDGLGDRAFEFGIDKAVFYPKNAPGVAWNGLVSVKEAPKDSEVRSNYIDGRKIQNAQLPGSFAATIEALTYPDEFEPYSGFGQQVYQLFNLCYRSKTETDAYKIHLVYNALVTPTEKVRASLNNQVQLTAFVWDLTTKPEEIPGYRGASHLIIDTTYAYDWAISAFENLIYGTDETPPTFPSITSVLDLFEDASILKITDNGDGTWTAEGPDDVVSFLDATTFQIDWPSVIYIDTDTYTVRSL